MRHFFQDLFFSSGKSVCIRVKLAYEIGLNFFTKIGDKDLGTCSKQNEQWEIEHRS